MIRNTNNDELIKVQLIYEGTKRDVQIWISNYAYGVPTATISSVRNIVAATGTIKTTLEIPDTQRTVVVPKDAI